MSNYDEVFLFNIEYSIDQNPIRIQMAIPFELGRSPNLIPHKSKSCRNSSMVPNLGISAVSSSNAGYARNPRIQESGVRIQDFSEHFLSILTPVPITTV